MSKSNQDIYKRIRAEDLFRLDDYQYPEILEVFSPRISPSAHIDQIYERMSDITSTQFDSRQLKITIGEITLNASLINSKTSEDFIKLLPLNLTMYDLFDREKYGALPKPVSTEGKRSYNYKIGDIGYWSLSHDLVIYYQDDGGSIPSPGIIILGKIESDMRALKVPGTAKVKIDLAPNPLPIYKN